MLVYQRVAFIVLNHSKSTLFPMVSYGFQPHPLRLIFGHGLLDASRLQKEGDNSKSQKVGIPRRTPLRDEERVD